MIGGVIDRALSRYLKKILTNFLCWRPTKAECICKYAMSEVGTHGNI